MSGSDAHSSSPRFTLTVLAAIHLSVVLWHGGAHSDLAVALSRFQYLFVFVVILIAPLIATLLLWTPALGFALRVYATAMFASLLFGVYYHYLAVSPDNVHYLPPGIDAARHRFVLTAGATAVTELIGTITAGFSLLVRPSHSNPRPTIPV